MFLFILKSFDIYFFFFFFSSRRRHTRSKRDWSSDVCSSDLRAVASDIERGISSRLHLPQPGNSWPHLQTAPMFEVVAFIVVDRMRSRANQEIGRASCRERVEMWGGGGAVKRKKQNGGC